MRGATRVPLFTSVEVRGQPALRVSYSRDISEHGIRLKALEADPAHIGIGDPLTLAFKLPPGDVLTVSARVVWVDPSRYEERGGQGIAIGLHFEPGQSAAQARIQAFIGSFRYRVAALDFPDVDTLREAVSDLYDVVAVENEAQLAELLVNGPVGLALVGSTPASGDLSARLRRALEALGGHGQPTLIYCGETPDAAAQSLIARTRNLVYSQWPLSALELRTIARRCVESHALGVENDRLTSELEGSLERLRRENSYLRGRAASARLEGIVGDSESMRRVYELVENVAPLATTVMVVGETGTGKELVARAIHARSERAAKPFVVQNCAALPETLLDTELFGHVRGAFTGAVADREGLFESASGGTIFLDEIGEMTAGMQAKLLRVLQDGEVRRIGSTRTTHVDVRVLCATHRDLAALVREHRFREDLYYRLRSFIVALPPLRERRGDIPVLASHFLARFAQRHKRSVAGLTEDALRLLEEHSWPGNVRELEHTLERLVVMCPPGGKVSAALVRETLRLSSPALESAQGGREGRGIDDVLRDYERQIITEELARAGGVLAAAARALGVDRSTLSKRCKRLGLRETPSTAPVSLPKR